MADLINKFKEVTGADDSIAKFYLEMAQNNLDVAIAAYLEPTKAPSAQNVPSPQAVSPKAPPQSSGPVGRRLGSDNNSSEFIAAPAPSAQKKPAAKKEPSKFKSLLDLQRDDDDDDDDEHNRYFAGGSKGSGELIIGGKKDNPQDKNDIASQIFKKAQERQGMDPDMQQPKPQEQSKFVGKGNRLGSGEGPVQQPKPQQQQQQEEEEMGDEQPKKITLTFYLDGFTIDEGELRRFDDPANQQFLEAINAGFVPAEIAKGAKQVDVTLVKKNEKYSPPPKSFKAFGGAGKALGASPSADSAPVAQQKPAPQNIKAYSCDLNKPHTSIQLRLHDGTRLVAKFNLTDTIQTICDFVSASCPGLSRPFVLATTFPKKELVELSQTIEQAKLQNAALVQTLK